MTDRTRIARQFIEAMPHARALGMELETLGEGVAVISMPYDARLVGDPATGVIHGGAVFGADGYGLGGGGDGHPEAPVGTATHRPAHRLHAPGDARPADHARGPNATMSPARSPSCGPPRWTRTAARPVATATGAFTVERGRGA